MEGYSDRFVNLVSDGTPLIRTQMAQKKVYILMRSPCFRGLIACELPLLERCPHFKGERAPLTCPVMPDIKMFRANEG